MGNLKVKDLFNHLQTYKDAVILFGNKAINKLANDIDAEILTNKVLRRNPVDFWNYYNHTVLNLNKELNDAQLAIKYLTDNDLSSKIINLTTDSRLYYYYLLNQKVELINLHGLCTQYKCTKCKKIIDTDRILIEPPVCDICKKPLRPNILLEGENYFDNDFHQMKEWLLNTHTIIGVGIDWAEDPIANLILDYTEMKDQRNKTEQEKRMVVLVGDDEIIKNFDELGNFEFVVHGDVNESMKRLIDKKDAE